MKNRVLIALSVVIFACVGCVGIGANISPAEGKITIDFTARDCITENLVARAIEVIPYIGDWVMLNWGCAAVDPPVVPTQ